MEIECKFDSNNPPSGRVYDTDSLKSVIDRYKDRVSKGDSIGKLSGRDDVDTLSNTSHIVTGVDLDADTGVVTVRSEVLDTSDGHIVKALLHSGKDVGIAPNIDISPFEGNKDITLVKQINSFDIVLK